MENGSLAGEEQGVSKALDWQPQFKIYLGSARGLAFLHDGFVPHIFTETSSPAIICGWYI